PRSSRLGGAQSRAGLAMASRSRCQPLVSHRAIVQAKAERRLEFCVRADRAGSEILAEQLGADIGAGRRRRGDAASIEPAASRCSFVNTVRRISLLRVWIPGAH